MNALRTTVMYLLDEWMTICMQGSTSDKTYSQYLTLLHQQRMISTPETTTKFFKTLLLLCVEHSTSQPDGTLTYTAIDALIKLFHLHRQVSSMRPAGNQRQTRPPRSVCSPPS